MVLAILFYVRFFGCVTNYYFLLYSGSELISTESQTDMLAVQPTVQIRYKVPDNVRDALTEAHQTIDELRQQSAVSDFCGCNSIHVFV